DQISTYERWRDRLADARREETAGGGRAAPPSQEPPNLHSSAQQEGTVVAVQTQTPIVGADPPGPTLRPDGIQGTVVTGRWLPVADDPSRSHVIRAGDTLYGIAVERYGDASYVRVIEAANPGLNPRTLKIGDRLVLPDKQEERPKPEAKAADTKVYVVRKNDTLIGIARRFYGDAAMYKNIYEANRDVLPSVNATLYVGQRLRLPERE
ncbi:MAG: LysM peptidoglycan-binding domain-containing protein, partial [Phycisphaerae bacterium]